MTSSFFLALAFCRHGLARPTIDAGWRFGAGWGIGLTVICLVFSTAGCDEGPLMPGTAASPLNPSNTAVSASEVPVRIVAQGTLQPKGGVLPLMAPPGDRVTRIAVAEGEWVEPGDLLVELESLRAKEVELEVAQTKLTEAKTRVAAETAAAQARLDVARTRLRQSESQLQQAIAKWKTAQADGGKLSLMKRAADLAERKLGQLQIASEDPSTPRMVSDHRLEEESLKIGETRAGYQNARAESTDAIDSATLAVKAAEQEIIAAEKTIEAAQATGAIGSLEKQIELLRLSLELARLKSPIRCRVMSLDATVGQATTTLPLMHLADTNEMVCVAEINVADLNRVEPGQSATITSPGLTGPLTGTVHQINRMIAPPELPNPFPMAPVDRHTSEVTIAINAESVEHAAERIQLQVEVVIQTQP